MMEPIYVGTNIGLCRYRAETDNFLPIIQVGAMTAVTDILEDSHQHLWIATSNSGVFKMINLNAESTVWNHYKKDKSEYQQHYQQFHHKSVRRQRRPDVVRHQ